ncbi:hypothetical protein Baya_9295 [Bagarius yarrelli]|uniref:Uncharacterized protein n=1 Tax=Bagarius yarrelli TaxID=175774 RepID=A0A556U6J1_BAGYA|nr:hypothetical protein Baya_9295 [Bagarius yarrelli]
MMLVFSGIDVFYHFPDWSSVEGEDNNRENVGPKHMASLEVSGHRYYESLRPPSLTPPLVHSDQTLTTGLKGHVFACHVHSHVFLSLKIEFIQEVFRRQLKDEGPEPYARLGGVSEITSAVIVLKPAGREPHGVHQSSSAMRHSKRSRRPKVGH